MVLLACFGLETGKEFNQFGLKISGSGMKKGIREAVSHILTNQ